MSCLLCSAVPELNLPHGNFIICVCNLKYLNFFTFYVGVESMIHRGNTITKKLISLFLLFNLRRRNFFHDMRFIHNMISLI